MPKAARSTQPRRMLRVATVISIIVAILVAAEAIVLWNRMNNLIQQDNILQKAMQDIALLDERLTSSAHLYAQTGDPSWQERYQKADVQLRAVIRVAQAQLHDEGARDALRELEIANDRLVAMERQSEQLAKEGQAAQAALVLSAPAYATEKDRYAQHLQSLQVLSRATSDLTLQRLREGNLLIILLAALCIVGLLVIFTRLGRSLRDYEHERTAAMAELDKLALVARETTNAVVITDRDGRIEWVNAGFTLMTGYQFEEVVGTEPGRLLQGERTDPDTVARVHDALRQGEAIQVEILNYGKDGREYWLDMQIQPIRNQDGVIRQFMAIESDITERKRMETALQEKEAQMRAVVENVADGIVTFDAEGRIMSFNKAAEAMFGRARNQVMGCNVSTLFPQPHQGAHENDIETSARTGFTRVIGQTRELEGLRSDGSCFPLEIAITEFRVGERHLFTGVARDITERKRVIEQINLARDRAEAANTAKSAFLANMSHEIRTPMNAIIGMSELLLTTAQTDRQRNYTDKIKSASASLLHVINDILDFSKIEAGKLTMEQIPFALDEVLDQLSGVMALRAENQGVELAFDISDGDRLLLGDPLRIGQILINLVGNAIKFSNRGNVIVRVETLSASEKEVELHFAVSDEGIGMTPEQVAQIFEPFSQADATTTRKYGGTGLGLAICKHLTEAMRGRIWAESEVDRGSTFHFTIMLGVAGADRRDGIAKFAAGLAEHAQRPVLLVDDNPVALSILSRLIQSLGLKVDTASSGQAALSLVEENDAPDYLACLIDWRMPLMDGVETIRRLRDAYTALDRERPPMLLVTANSSQVSMDEAKHDIDGLLAKPVTARFVYVELARCLGVLQDDAPTVERRTAGTSRWAKFRRLDILLVEDVEFNQEVIVELLAAMGLSARLARNGAEAIASIEENPPDLVLMDVQMPVMDGYEATRLLRAKPAYQALPIIALTANATLEDQAKCIEAGMNSHVAKPINMEILLERMEQCLPDISATGSPTVPDADPDRA